MHLVIGSSCELGMRLCSTLASSGAQVIACSRDIDKISHLDVHMLMTFDPLHDNPVEFILSNQLDGKIHSFYYLSALRDPDALNETDVWKVNLHCYRNFIKSLTPSMRLNRFGRFLSFSSSGSKYGGGLNKEHYSLSKACLEQYNRIDIQNSGFGVFTNTIRLGVLEGNSVSDSRLNMIPSKQLVSLVDVIDISIWLNSSRNSSVSLSTYPITGGE